MMDVIPILTFMSLAFQKEHVELASVQAMVKLTITQITALKSKNGKFLSEILPSQDDVSEVKWRENTIKVTAREVQQFESIKLKFLDNVVNALMHSGFLVSAMCVFKMKISQPTEMSMKSWKRCFPNMGLQRKPKVVKMYQQLWMPKNADLNGTLLKSWLLESITPWATLLSYGKCSLPLIVIKSKI